MKLFAPDDFVNRISTKYVYPMCGGENISPALKWGDYPTDTKSFAITMFDPDAPTDHGWWHWIVLNISNNINSLPQGAGNPVSEYFDLGLQTVNDYGELGYGGPCPPPGPAHRYLITVYAMRVEGFKVSKETNPQIVAEYIQKYAIDSVTVMGKYARGWE